MMVHAGFTVPIDEGKAPLPSNASTILVRRASGAFLFAPTGTTSIASTREK